MPYVARPVVRQGRLHRHARLRLVLNAHDHRQPGFTSGFDRTDRLLHPLRVEELVIERVGAVLCDLQPDGVRALIAHLGVFGGRIAVVGRLPEGVLLRRKRRRRNLEGDLVEAVRHPRAPVS